MNVCRSNKVNYSEYTSCTKFNIIQLKNIHLFFKRFSKSEDYFTLDEFRNSLGVLGNKSSEYIYKRMFEILSDNGNNKTVIFNKRLVNNYSYLSKTTFFS